MSKKSISKTSQTDWAYIAKLRDEDIKFTREHPEADPAHIVRGILRKGLKPLSPKKPISLRVESDVLEWFKAQGPGWQTKINVILKAYKEEASKPLSPNRRRRAPASRQRRVPR